MTIESQAFKKWFGDSKVVDDNGKPQVVYHGTTANFNEFDPSHKPVNDDGYMGVGSYFIANPKDAANYAEMARDNAPGEPRVIPVYLALKNPYRLSPGDPGTYGMGRDEAINWTQDISKRGYDGVVNSAGDEYVAFHPEQIKSATGNSGAFDPASPNIFDSDPREACLVRNDHWQDDGMSL